MKQIYILLLTALLFTPSLQASPSALPDSVAQLIAECEPTRKASWATHYCICQHTAQTLETLPLDITLTDSAWYSADINNFLNGITAYLYGESMVHIDVYLNCKAKSSRFTIEVAPNQTCDVDKAAIQQKLEEQGLSNISGFIKMVVYPLEKGKECRVLCNAYNEGPLSTCSDPFPIIPGMTFVSSHPQDVYVLQHESIPVVDEAQVEWFKSTADCHLRITRGSCDGEEVLNAELSSSYALTPSLLNDARSHGEDLYFHFSHAEGSSGRIRLTFKESAPSAVDNTLLPSTSARLVMGVDGVLYIQRDNHRYSLTGQRID